MVLTPRETVRRLWTLGEAACSSPAVAHRRLSAGVEDVVSEQLHLVPGQLARLGRAGRRAARHGEHRPELPEVAAGADVHQHLDAAVGELAVDLDASGVHGVDEVARI